MFKTILVATDGSDHANRAAQLASDIAAKYDAKLVFVHVLMHGHVPEAFRHMAEVEHLIESAPASGPRTGNVPANLAATLGQEKRLSGAASEQLFELLAERITERCRKEARKLGVREERINTVIEAGDPAKCIIDVQQRVGADLIVMGSRGLGDLRGLVLGSVSHKLAHLAECACLTVK